MGGQAAEPEHGSDSWKVFARSQIDDCRCLLHALNVMGDYIGKTLQWRQVNPQPGRACNATTDPPSWSPPLEAHHAKKQINFNPSPPGFAASNWIFWGLV